MIVDHCCPIWTKDKQTLPLVRLKVDDRMVGADIMVGRLAKYMALEALMDERTKRMWAATEALGRGGGARVVGVADTAAFVVETLRRWWRHMGSAACLRTRRVPVTTDAYGSNASRRLSQSNGRFTFAAALCAAAMLASGVHADLFLPVGAAGAMADVAPAAIAAPAGGARAGVPNAWERRVRIARHELTAARRDVETAGAGRLLLNVRDGARLNVDVEQTSPTRWGYSLSGRVVGGSSGFATLVVHEEAVAGSIWTPDSAYELTYLGGGVHALRDVTDAPSAKCGGALPSGFAASGRSRPSAQQGGVDAADDGSVVDILVVWTPAAEEHHGGEPQVLSQIDMFVSYTNDALGRSGAFISLNLVGAEKVDYLENGDTDIERLANPDDGHMDGIHDRRNALGADLVFLLRARLEGTVSGRAQLGGPFAAGVLNARTFAHEIGHNFGIRHERHQAASDALLGSYRNGFTTRDCYATILSYNAACRVTGSLEARSMGLPFYASPWRYDYGGSALGVTRFSKERGARGPADAVLTLNRNRHRVANFRPSRNGE